VAGFFCLERVDSLMMKQMRNIPISFLAAMAALPAIAEEGVVPQMDQTWYSNQILWLVISFALLYVIVSKVIVPSVSLVLNDRESAIKTAIRDAEYAKREAESTKSDFESATSSSRTAAADLLAKAQAENNRDAADAMGKLDHELDKKSDRAALKINEAVAKAQSGMQAATVTLAASMAEKLLGHAVSAESVETAVGPLAKVG
jgi:F-type H+-transporting ATPase subunit b